MNIINKEKYKIILTNDYIHIINYIKIININKTDITIELININIKIIGKDLLINALDKYEVLISGIFKGIDYIDK